MRELKGLWLIFPISLLCDYIVALTFYFGLSDADSLSDTDELGRWLRSDTKNNPFDAITPRGFVWVPSIQVKWQIFGELADKSKHNI